MTVRPDQPPLTRRELRARERESAERAENSTRRADTDAAAPEATDGGSDRRAETSEPAVPLITIAAPPAAPDRDEPGSASGSQESEHADATSDTGPVSIARSEAVITAEGVDRPLTRREMRALLEAQEAERQAALRGATADSVSAVVVHEETGRVVEADPSTAETFQPAIPAWIAETGEVLPVSEPSVGDEPYDHLLQVGTGSVAVTTSNALILPVVPQGDSAKPIDGTGEILITGSLDLPQGLGSTGQHPNFFDSAELDRMEEREQREQPTTQSGAIPVRASSAISTHSSTRGMITPPHSRGSRLPLILGIIAGALFLGVAGVLVGGFVFGAF